MSDDLRAISISFEMFESEEDEWAERIINLLTYITRRQTDIHWSSRLVPLNEREADDE